MPSNTLIDQRGYVFSLLTLGLPDPEGEWVSISAAIGTRDQAIPLLKGSLFSEARRYARKGCAIIAVEYEGAAWILPFCAPEITGTEIPFFLRPEQATTATESFTLKVRRLPLTSIAESSRIKLPDGLALWFATHPDGLSSFQPPERHQSSASQPSHAPTCDDEQAFWQGILATLQEDSTSPKTLPSNLLCVDWDKLNSTSHPAVGQICRDRVREPGTINWDHSPADALEKSWQHEVMMQIFREMHRSPEGIKLDIPGLSIQSRSDTGATITFMYAFTFGTPPPPPTREQWKPIPTRAWKPGYELKFVNQVREAYGLRPFGQNELHLSRSASSS